MLLRGKRIAAIAVALTVMVMLVACDGGDGDADPTTASTASATPTATDEADAAAVLEKFWAERVRVESSGDYDNANFEGILGSTMIEPQLQRYKQYGEWGFQRVGKPELRDFTAEVDGATAIATVCVQEDEWGAKADIKVDEAEPQGWYASSHRLERTDGTWLIVGTVKTPAGVTC